MDVGGVAAGVNVELIVRVTAAAAGVECGRLMTGPSVEEAAAAVDRLVVTAGLGTAVCVTTTDGLVETTG